MNLYVVIMYFIFHSFINAFSSPLRTFDPKKMFQLQFPTIISFRIFDVSNFNKKGLIFDLSNFSSGERSEQLFNITRAVPKSVQGVVRVLRNVYSWKRLTATRTLISSLNPGGLCTLNVVLGIDVINLRICFLKVLTDSKF